MLYFKNRKSRSITHQPQSKDKAAIGIASFLLALQVRFSLVVNKRVKGLNSKGKQVLLMLFSVFFGSLSLYAFIGAFQNSDNYVQYIKPAQLSLPQYFNHSGMGKNSPVITDKDIISIDRFYIYKDSLNVYREGRSIYDSILRARPHLIDSIKHLKQFYYSQTK